VSGLPPWLARHANVGLAALVDHTLLKAEATRADIARLVEEAVALGFGAVCVNGQWVPEAVRRLRGSRVRVAAVAGFPLGASGAAAKVAEVRALVADGADELDVVIALGRACAGEWDLVGTELAAVVQAAAGRPVKAILETALLSPEAADQGCRVAHLAGAAMVKTSTGFHAAGGATVEAVARLRRAVGGQMGVKASGGIRTAAEALSMLWAGADRIGASGAAGWSGLVGPGAPALGALSPE
jgi:deoxyribose-phosphate aldolase